MVAKGLKPPGVDGIDNVDAISGGGGVADTKGLPPSRGGVSNAAAGAAVGLETPPARGGVSGAAVTAVSVVALKGLFPACGGDIPCESEDSKSRANRAIDLSIRSIRSSMLPSENCTM